jgi:hypothetical protein
MHASRKAIIYIATSPNGPHYAMRWGLQYKQLANGTGCGFAGAMHFISYKTAL